MSADAAQLNPRSWVMVVHTVAAAVAALQGDDDDAKDEGLSFLWSNSLGYGGFSDSDLAAIRERGGIPPLLALLSETSDAFHVLLRLLRDDAESKVAIREAGGIPMLIELVNVAPYASYQSDAAQLLGTLSFENTENKLAIRVAGGIESLLKLVKIGRSSSARFTAAQTLRTLARGDDDSAVAIALARGRAEAFVQLARRGRVDGRGYVLVDNAGAAAKRKAALVVAALLRDFPVPREMKAVIASYL